MHFPLINSTLAELSFRNTALLLLSLSWTRGSRCRISNRRWLRAADWHRRQLEWRARVGRRRRKVKCCWAINQHRVSLFYSSKIQQIQVIITSQHNSVKCMIMLLERISTNTRPSTTRWTFTMILTWTKWWRRLTTRCCFRTTIMLWRPLNSRLEQSSSANACAKTEVAHDYNAKPILKTKWVPTPPHSPHRARPEKNRESGLVAASRIGCSITMRRALPMARSCSASCAVVKMEAEERSISSR